MPKKLAVVERPTSMVVHKDMTAALDAVREGINEALDYINRAVEAREAYRPCRRPRSAR